MVGEFPLAGGTGRIRRAQRKVAGGAGYPHLSKMPKQTLALVEAVLNGGSLAQFLCRVCDSRSSDNDRVCCLFVKVKLRQLLPTSLS